jgi:hypothetical protein
MKTISVEAELSHTDRQTDRQEATKLIVSFCNCFAKAPTWEKWCYVARPYYKILFESY